MLIWHCSFYDRHTTFQSQIEFETLWESKLDLSLRAYTVPYWTSLTIFYTLPTKINKATIMCPCIKFCLLQHFPQFGHLQAFHVLSMDFLLNVSFKTNLFRTPWFWTKFALSIQLHVGADLSVWYIGPDLRVWYFRCYC